MIVAVSDVIRLYWHDSVLTGAVVFVSRAHPHTGSTPATMNSKLGNASLIMTF